MLYSSSLACGNWLSFGEEADLLVKHGYNIFHIDIMDGHYVPNLCLTLDLVKQLKAQYQCIIDVHLMTEDTEAYLERCATLGVDMCTFHFEAVKDPLLAINKIRTLSMKPGIAINPETPIESIKPFLENVDLCLVMAVRPGFSGQKFSVDTYEKIKQLDIFRKEEGLDFNISVDGGITPEIGSKCRKLGADMLVMGAFTFFEKDKDRTSAIFESVNTIEGRTI